jgi:hypothetical protein
MKIKDIGASILSEIIRQGMVRVAAPDPDVT